MTKRYALLSACALMLTNAFAQESKVSDSRNCGSMEVLERLLQENPEMQQKLNQIESQTATYLQRSAAGSVESTDNTVIIPVVFHVVYRTAAQNVPLSSLLNQLEVLNKDYAKLNTDAGLVPAHFAGVAANTNIQFCLATVDPYGNPTSGVTRTQTKKTSFSSNDGIKRNSAGGKDAWPADKYLNFWVGNLSNGLLGYAQFPGGPAATDGVVCLYSSLPGGSAANYNKGRTATHEVGHWLNLRHIWGDATCGNDLVSDTPTHNTSNGGCPTSTHRSTCSGTPLEMWMNYMDYTYDACMYMFTAGQASRMNALFAAGGARASLITSGKCGPTVNNQSVSNENPALRMAAGAETKIYPNPVTHEMTIGYTVASESANVSVEIYNTMGVMVNRIAIGEQAQGYHTYQVSLDQQIGSLANGAYLCVVKTGDTQQIVRFMLVR